MCVWCDVGNFHQKKKIATQIFFENSFVCSSDNDFYKKQNNGIVCLKTFFLAVYFCISHRVMNLFFTVLKYLHVPVGTMYTCAIVMLRQILPVRISEEFFKFSLQIKIHRILHVRISLKFL